MYMFRVSQKDVYKKNILITKKCTNIISDVLVSLEIDTVIVKSDKELVTLILQYTKAVAEEPAK